MPDESKLMSPESFVDDLWRGLATAQVDKVRARDKAVRLHALEDVIEKLEILAASPLGNGVAEHWIRVAVERVKKMVEVENG